MSDADAEGIARIRERITALEVEQRACNVTQNDHDRRITILERWAWVIIGGATVVAGLGAILIDAARKHYGF